ncbi:MAG: restriction endonuclease subunit S, partial [Treponema sp.]|nr:restriction endonuclease subunit S [Candidatus Treponema merdequi]
MEDWKETPLSEITSLITKGTTPSMIGASFTESGIKYIKSESILDNSRILDSSKFAFISLETHDRLKRSQIEENDLLFSMAGMFLGKTAIVTKNDIPANTNQAVAIIRIIPNKADFKFIYYYLNQKNIVKYINNLSGQSAQPNINLQQIGSLNINLPPLPTQQKIAQILSSLDDKIELNNKINANLE